MLGGQPNNGWQLCFPLYLHVGGSHFRLYDGSYLKTYLLIRWQEPDALAVVGPSGVYLLDFFCSEIQFYLLLSLYLYFISFVYLDLYVVGDLVGWFCCFTSQINSYGHCGTVSSPNHTFSWAGVNKRLTSNCAHTFACN